MRHVMTVLCITAVIVLAASATRALANSGDIQFDNQFGPGSNDPYATAMGCIWINTGNGVLFKVPNLAVENGDGFPPPASDCAWDLNIELLGGTTPTQPCSSGGKPEPGAVNLHKPVAEGHPVR